MTRLGAAELLTRGDLLAPGPHHQRDEQERGRSPDRGGGRYPSRFVREQYEESGARSHENEDACCGEPRAGPEVAKRRHGRR